MPDRSCAVDGCNLTVRSRGWCVNHYMSWKVYGDPLASRRRTDITGAICSEPGCEIKVKSLGLCQRHYSKAYSERKKLRRIPCIIEGCTRFQRGGDLCNMHYMRKRTTGDVGPAHPVKRDNGTGSVTGQGYIWLQIDNRKIAEHRLVMEQVLGRRLEDFENVHHINGRRSDNRPDNLELWVVPQPYGQRAIDLADWVIATYPDLIKERTP